MIEALANAFRVPDLRRRILFTLAIIGLYRVGAHIPVPGINVDQIQNQLQEGALGLLNLFAGGALENFAVFSLGIMPYITSSIIMQLLQGVIPTIERWSKEGESGMRKMTQTTRYMTLGIALLQSLGLLTVFRQSLGVTFNTLTASIVIVTLIAGTALIMWMGELITQRGIGNGMSLLIFASIVSRFPLALWQSISASDWIVVIATMIVLLIAVAAIVLMERGQRRIPVQYAKRVVGRKVYGGAGTYIPFKVNSAGVIPIIFASAMLFFPAQIAGFFPDVQWLANLSRSLTSGWAYYAMYGGLVVFFTYFYSALVFNPIDLADNLRKNGGFIPGVRPGKATTNYLESVMNRIILPGAVFLALIAIGPQALFRVTNVQLLNEFGGTSILIMVGVGLETMTQLESQLKMRHYDGFFK